MRNVLYRGVLCLVDMCSRLYFHLLLSPFFSSDLHICTPWSVYVSCSTVQCTVTADGVHFYWMWGGGYCSSCFMCHLLKGVHHTVLYLCLSCSGILCCNGRWGALIEARSNSIGD